MTPPPPQLDRREFYRRCDRLRACGRPVSFENVNPEFVEWLEKSRRNRCLRYRVLIVALVLLAALMIAYVARGK